MYVSSGKPVLGLGIKPKRKLSMGATAKFVFCNGVLKESASFDGCLVPVQSSA